MFDLTVSIVTYKTDSYQLKRCLSSLELYTGNIFIYLIDNSPSNDLSEVSQGLKNVEYVHLSHNPGFGSGHNEGIRRAVSKKTNFHLVLNADIYFHSDIITPLLEYLNSNPNVGMIMPKILNPDNSIQRLCKLVPTPLDLLARRLLPNSLRRFADKRFELHSTCYDKIMYVPYLSGCFMLIRKKTLEDVGAFDERFFMYPEDIDLSRRIASLQDTIFFPLVSAYHVHGAESHKSIKMFMIHSYNIIKYFNKWGWIYDPGRRKLNKKTISLLKKLKE
jgi:GT2 family glycosyltransferase